MKVDKSKKYSNKSQNNLMKNASSKYRRYKSVDPFPEIAPSLLNSADIHDYIMTTGMIDPYYKDDLKSASYSIRLKGKYYFVDDDNNPVREEIKEGEIFPLKKNSIAFVTLEPIIRLPDYIAARFNFKISNVYKGLLLGTGPLVDPGYEGPLQIPIHNLTSNEYRIRGGDTIIWMEFTKISNNEKWKIEKPTKTVRSGQYIEFPKEKKGLDLDDLLIKAEPHREVSSNLSAIRNEISDTYQRMKRLRFWQWASIIGVVSILIVLTINFLNTHQQYSSQSQDLYENIKDAHEKLLDTKNQIQIDRAEIYSRIDSIESILKTLENQNED